MQHHWICKKVLNKEIVIFYISASKMVANGMTKLLQSQKFKAFKVMLEMTETKIADDLTNKDDNNKSNKKEN